MEHPVKSVVAGMHIRTGAQVKRSQLLVELTVTEEKI